ncbi:MAG: hypothetical protein K2G25_05790 [Oscillospiraceae bacterium]|nr:hypothetical protein [Oscillospiraceae bacterium]
MPELLVNSEMNSQEDPAIYLVLSQTGTILSRLLKHITKTEYNHVSISLDKKIDHMYSFGRRNPYNPVWGGFMQESPFFGTMKRFHNTTAVILRVPVSAVQYQNLTELLTAMYTEKEKYAYNIPGLLLAALGIVYHHENQYYCSEFVRYALTKFQIIDPGQFKPITIPEDFLKLDSYEIIYIGNLREYAFRYASEQAILELLQEKPICTRMFLKLEHKFFEMFKLFYQR